MMMARKRRGLEANADAGPLVFDLAFSTIFRHFSGLRVALPAMLLCGEKSDMLRALEQETSSFEAQGRQLGFASHA